MREGKRAPTVVGGSSLLVIFAVLCLTVFAVLSLTQAQADRRLAQNSWSCPGRAACCGPPCAMTGGSGPTWPCICP